MTYARALLPALVLAILTSCGGGSSEKAGEKAKQKTAQAVQKAREAAEAARQKAEEAGAPKYAKALFDKAVQYYETANNYLDQGKLTSAKSRFYMARRQFERAAQEAPRNKAKFTRLETKLKEVQRLRDKAKKAGAETLVKILWEDALSQLKQAEEQLQSGSNLIRVESMLSRARASFNDALSEVERKKEELARLERFKKLALEEKKLMLEKRKLAAEKGGETKRATEFGYADDTARDGDRYFEEKNYEMALEQYRAAKSQFLQIIESIEAEKQFAATQTQAPPVAPGTDTQLTPPEEAPQPSPALAPDQQSEVPAAPTGFDGLVAANLDKLVSGVPNYENGKLSVDYTDGRTLQKDVLRARSPFLKYQFKESGMEHNFSFWAGGTGYLFLKPQFRREVTATFKCHVELLEPGSTIIAQVLSNGRIGYGSLFGVYAGLVRGARMVRAMPTKFAGAKGAPKNWVDRKEPHEWQLRTVWPSDAKYGTLEVYYDGELVSKYPALKNETGFVGFVWLKSKFRIIELRIEGVPDPKWVIDTLEKKGVTVSDDIKIEVGLMKPKKKKSSKSSTKKTSTSGSSGPKPGGKELDF